MPTGFDLPCLEPPLPSVGIFVAQTACPKLRSDRNFHIRKREGDSEDPTPRGRVGLGPTPLDPPSYLPWYTSPAPTIAAAYVSIGGAGLRPLQTPVTAGRHGRAQQISAFSSVSDARYGLAPLPRIRKRHKSHPTTAAPGSFTHHGAAEDCNQDDSFLCPGGVSNKAFGVTVMVSPLPTAHSAYYVA